MLNPIIFIMGVSGSGKTTIGQLLSQQTGIPFLMRMIFIRRQRRHVQAAPDDERRENIGRRFDRIGDQRVRISQHASDELRNHERRIHEQTGLRCPNTGFDDAHWLPAAWKCWWPVRGSRMGLNLPRCRNPSIEKLAEGSENNRSDRGIQIRTKIFCRYIHRQISHNTPSTAIELNSGA